MSMRSVTFFVAATAALLLAPSAGAGEPEAPKPKVSPLKAAQTAAKNLVKVPNYIARVDVVGGLSDREDHEVTDKTMGETYEGELYNSSSGPLMHIGKGMNAYRYPKRGTMLVQGDWRDILSDRTGTRMTRLFTFPEQVLARALGYGSSARWLTPAEEKERLGARYKGPKVKEAGDDEEKGKEKDSGKEKDEGSGDESNKIAAGDTSPDGDDPKPADPKKAEKPDAKAAKKAGPTVVVKPKPAADAAKRADDGYQPRIVHIDVPPKEALVHFTEVQNSGCMSAG